LRLAPGTPRAASVTHSCENPSISRKCRIRNE
jgi:hypothetical protein